MRKCVQPQQLSNGTVGRPRSLHFEGEEKVPRKRAPRTEEAKTKRVIQKSKVKTKLIHDLEKEVKGNDLPSPTSQTNYLEEKGGCENVDDNFTPD